MKQILIVCNMGISSTLLKKEIEKEADNDEVKVHVSDVAGVDELMEAEKVDAILVSPQIGFLETTYQRKYGDLAYVTLIDDADFVNLNGKAILAKTLKAID